MKRRARKAYPAGAARAARIESAAGAVGAARTARDARTACAAVLAAVLALSPAAGPAASESLSGCLTAYAITRPAGLDDLTWLKLQDNVMEYEELENLVRYYNPSYQQVLESIMPMIDASRQTASQMKSSEELKTMKDQMKEIKKTLDQMDPNSQSLEEQLLYQQLSGMYGILQASVQGTEQGIKAIRKTANTLDGDTRAVREQTLKSLTFGAQQMFIGYNQALASLDLCSAAVELAQAAANSAQVRYGIGMATEEDVLSAQQSLLTALSQQQSLNDTLTTLRQNLCLMTGWTYNADPVIGTVPAPDLARIDSMNPESDIPAAIAASYSLDTLKDSLTGKTAVRKNRTLGEAEETIKIQVNTLYQTVLADKASYDAAQTALAAANIAKESADRQYSLGAIGRLQYLQLQLSYLQQKMAADAAAMTLTQSILTYEWALDGIILNEQQQEA